MRFIMILAVLPLVLVAAPVALPAVEGMDAFHRQLMNHAQKSIENGDDARAAGLLSKILEAYPEDRETLRLAAEAFYRQGGYQEAAGAYSRILRLNPEDGEAMVRLALSRWRMKQGYEAEAALERALSGKDLSAETAALARRTLNEVYDDWDVLKVMQQRDDYAAQERFHSYHIARDPEGTAVSYALRGFARHWLRRPDEAREDFDRALSLGGLSEDLAAGVRDSLGVILQAEEERRMKELEEEAASLAPPGPRAEAGQEPSVVPAAEQGGQEAEPAATRPWVDPYASFDRIDALLLRGDERGASRVLDQLRGLSLRGEESGVYRYYRAELAWRTGDFATAAKGFEQAARLIGERFRRSAARMRLAEYHAARGDKELAESYAVRSAAALADQAWKQRQAAGLFLSLGDTEKAVAYYAKALALEPDAEKNRETFRGLAEAYKLTGDTSKYHAYAQYYLDAAEAQKEALPEAERGTAHFYRAELLEQRGEVAAAYEEYEKASLIVTEKYRLSEIYMKMADYLADSGEEERAARYAVLAARLLPDQPWRNRSVAGLFGRIGRVDEAIAYTRLAISQEPDRPGADLELAYLHLRNRDKSAFLVAHAAYIDKLTDRVSRLGKSAPRELVQELYDARRRNAEMSRTWGFDSYNFGTMRDNNDYSVMTINELFYNFSLPAGVFGKVYHRLNATPGSRYSGSYSDPVSSQTNRWESRSNLEDSAYGIVGVKINPVTVLPDLGIGVEYLYPIGSEQSHDFRGRLEYNRTWGEKPRLFDNRWNYAKTYGELVYSSRDNDFVSFGELGFGQTFSWEFDRNLLVIPHVRANWSYGGEEIPKGSRWGLEAGPALAVRKWFNEDKYNAPRSYVEVGVNYTFGLSHELDNGIGFNVTFSF